MHIFFFPTAFKRAKVIPFPKTKTISTDLIDYRPILILSVLTKPLERHIHKHLTVLFLETHHRFHSFRSGFRCGYSSQTAVTRLTGSQLSTIVKCQVLCFSTFARHLTWCVMTFYSRSYPRTT